YLFGKRVGSVPLMALAAADFCSDPDPDRLTAADDSEGINLFYMVQTAFAEQEIRSFSAVPAPLPGIWYPSVGLKVCRAGAYTAGMKAGCNDDSHNHNDTGSVTLYKDGQPLLIDVGVETYSRKTFSPQRYEIWTMQSCYHNLPRFFADGHAYDEQPGAEFAARDVRVTDDGLAMDIAPAYGSVPGLSCYLRTLRLTADGLALCDETDFPGAVELNLLTCQRPEISGQGEYTIRFGALGQAEISGQIEAICIDTIPVTDPRLRTAWPDTLYRTRVRFAGELNVFVR
ncbi:MAG: heparinase II/III family protein, partial [Gemmiger sp.]